MSDCWKRTGPAHTDRRGLWIIDGDSTRWLGVVFFAAGGALRIWPVFGLGRRFSGLVAIQPEHTLVRTDVYRVIRHPSYLGLLTLSLGWALAFRSWIGARLTALMIPPFVARIQSEEGRLRQHFGVNTMPPGPNVTNNSLDLLSAQPQNSGDAEHVQPGRCQTI